MLPIDNHMLRAALVGALFGPADTIDQLIDQKIPVQPGERLVIGLGTGGAVEIIGWHEPAVSVVAALRDGACPDGRMTVSRENGTVSVTSTLPDGAGHRVCAVPDVIAIKVPDHFDVSIESNGGGVTIAGVSGRIEGTTNGGNVSLARLDGRVHLTTMGGDVAVTASHLEGSVHTLSGHVTFTDVSGGVHGVSDSDGGDVTGGATGGHG